MKTNIQLLFILSLLMQIFGCKPDKPAQLAPLLIPEEMKAYTLFKPGTYWVYQDSISGAIDCVYVTSYDDYQFDHEYDDIGNRTYEQFDMEIFSSYEGYAYNFQQNSTYARYCVDENQIRPCFYTWVYKYKPGNYVGIRFDFFYEIEVGYNGTQYWTSDDTITINHFYNTLNFDGKNYSNVVEIFIKKDRLEKYCNTKYFHCKNVGVVRKENLDSLIVWNIIKYNVVQ